MTEKKIIKAQLKKDKARLKELKKLDKVNGLSVEETWEYVRLQNAGTERTWKQTEKLQITALVFLGLAGVAEIISLIITILKILKS